MIREIRKKISEKSHEAVEDIAIKATKWIGSTGSLIFHTIIFIGAFMMYFWGIPLDNILLVLTTIVSLEAIYLSIFIQMSVNRQDKKLHAVAEDVEDIQEGVEDIQEDVDEIQKDVDDIQEDVEEIQKDVDDIQEDVEEIQKDVDDIQEDVEEIQEEDEEEEKIEKEEDDRINRIENMLGKLIEEILDLKKQQKQIKEIKDKTKPKQITKNSD
jgi:uncharacterized protein YoxC